MPDMSGDYAPRIGGEWSSRDFNWNRRWQITWPIWEFMILRHNNGKIPKEEIKEYLNPLLMLNGKFVRLRRCKRR